ncbi:MAG: hypothetical protein KC636_26435 [Myxococcales bacterium]|nr:hypothetical protein [Myxococcales bacterium]
MITHDPLTRPSANGSRRRALAAVAPLVVALSCTIDSHLDEPLHMLPPVATRAAIVYVDAFYNDALFVIPGDEAVTTAHISLGDPARLTPQWAVPTRDGDAVLVMMTPADAKQEDVEEQLLRLPGDGGGEPKTYDVRAPFNAVALSPDQRRAVLHFTAANATNMLQNANQVAFVDLDGASVRNLTLNGFGGRLLAVEFPGQLTEGAASPVLVDGVPRDIAAFLAEGEIVLVDMDDANLDQVAVPFDEQVGFVPSTTMIRPGDALFADPALFVLSSVGSDVGMLTLTSEPGGDGFTAQVSLIPVGAKATDFNYYNSAEIPYLITVNSNRALVFTDIRTQGGFSIPLETTATNLFLRDHDRDGEVVPQVVTWAEGGTYLYTLDLDGIEDSLGRKPGELKIQTGVEAIVQLDNDRALIGSGTTLYVVDFPREQVTPLTAMSAYDPFASVLRGDTLLLGTPGQDWVSTVDLQNLNPESMVLDASIQSFHYLPDAGKIVLLHFDTAGYMTVVESDDPSRATSYSAWGYLLDGVLDRDPPSDKAVEPEN